MSQAKSKSAQKKAKQKSQQHSTSRHIDKYAKVNELIDVIKINGSMAADILDLQILGPKIAELINAELMKKR